MNHRLGLPLYAKILLWLLLNAVALLLMLGVVLSVGFGVEVGSVFAAGAGGQAKSVGRLLMSELRDLPRYEWNLVVDRYDEAYGVRFLLLDPRGGQVAGASVPLPEVVRGEVDERGPRRSRGPEERGGVLRAGGYYWLVQRLPPPPGRGGEGPPALGWLIVRSESVSAGGLFFDLRPWVAGVLIAVVFSILWWLPFVRGITRAISAMQVATGRVARGEFDLVPGSSADRGNFAAALRRRDEVGALARDLQEMSRRLGGYVNGQRRFLGDIAHELSAPIARAQLAVEILARRVGDEERERVGDLREEVEEMSKLVNELLSFSKAALAANNIELGSVNVREVIDGVVAREAGDGSVEVNVPLDFLVRGNAELLNRAIGNLLRNSVRYAGAAGPITIRGERDRQGVTVTVDDLGPGVPDEAIGKLFDPFYRADASRNRDTGGVGLGLAIVKNAIQACGGAVRCWNRDPAGFSVELRLVAADPDR